MKIDPALTSSYHFCGEIARLQARNFYHAFRLLPRAQRASMCALYAFMRHTDDLADSPVEPEAKAQALDAWQAELDAALAGLPARWPGLPALADTVARAGIPHHLLHAVIDGVRLDTIPRRFANFAELSHYCYLVASVVGLCCLHIWGYRSEGGKAERLAETCGLALQLTNILRDVREDARLGRIYLPLDELESFGVDPAELDSDQPSARLRDLFAFQAKRAYGFYNQASELVPLVLPQGRPVLLTIVGIYRALLDEIVRRDYNVLASRISISSWRKLAIAVHSIPQRFAGTSATLLHSSTP
jgi:phytoene synthase